LVLILFILGIILVTVLPHIARINPIRDRDAEFQAEKKPTKVIPIIVPVYPKDRPPKPEPRIIRLTPQRRRRVLAVPNIATVYRRQSALPTPVNVPNSVDIGLSQKNV